MERLQSRAPVLCRIPGAAVLALAVTLAAGCGDDAADEPIPEIPTVEWERGEALVLSQNDTIPLDVEIAETNEQRSYGLMHRDSLAQNAGMIFLYDSPQPAEGSFWMFNTRIPLDIAFLDAEGNIVSIRQMEPCTSPYPQWCRSYESGVPFESALEMNAGWFAQNGVEVGDRVILTR